MGTDDTPGTTGGSGQHSGRNRLTRVGPGIRQVKDRQLEAILRLQQDLDCDAIGIRLVDDDGNLIYRVHSGFPEGFCNRISGTCIHDDHCICVRILRDDLTPYMSFCTDRGSLVVGSVSELRRVTRGNPSRISHLTTDQNPCFQSVAVTPLRCMGHNLGIIHSAAGQAGHFTPERVRILEETADEIARDLFYDSLWRPVHGLGEPRHPVRAQAICPICGRRRESDDTWEIRDAAPTELSWTVLGAPRIVCPTCLRLCNLE